jgi:hypothetical protein
MLAHLVAGLRRSPDIEMASRHGNAQKFVERNAGRFQPTAFWQLTSIRTKWERNVVGKIHG